VYVDNPVAARKGAGLQTAGILVMHISGKALTWAGFVSSLAKIAANCVSR